MKTRIGLKQSAKGKRLGFVYCGRDEGEGGSQVPIVSGGTSWCMSEEGKCFCSLVKSVVVDEGATWRQYLFCFASVAHCVVMTTLCG